MILLIKITIIANKTYSGRRKRVMLMKDRAIDIIITPAIISNEQP